MAIRTKIFESWASTSEDSVRISSVAWLDRNRNKHVHLLVSKSGRRLYGDPLVQFTGVKEDLDDLEDIKFFAGCSKKDEKLKDTTKEEVEAAPSGVVYVP